MRLLPFALLLTGCATSSVSGPLPAPAAPPLRALAPTRIPEAKSQRFYRFAWKDRSFTVGAGEWKRHEDANFDGMYGWAPVVWVKTAQGTRTLDLRADFPSHYVARVFESEAGRKIVLFLDYGIEGPLGAYVVWISEDGGERWFRGQDLPRPQDAFPPADLAELYLDAQGEGTAWLRKESGEAYRAVTHDGARSWSVDGKPKSLLKSVKGTWR